ncbi:hypothetical protein GBZ48_25680 [Azospirillum melinis]|uniref:Uncharacterized protein n=1 Tax=Azospirillum melinis TaxID=328839 RepID=A0ABX2KG97_9PROT|nr:hypothetical protein [Azospirillum melinis]MBP2309490.1 hypothetical protein [Azospirillum melinis]NUB02640.1 hypothetical protein [Azospirillum melinis]
MTARIHVLAVAAALSALCAATAAHAHYPVCECRMADGQTVVCTGGFSDGSKAPGVVLDVIAYDEQVLVKGRLGEDSTLSFPRPAQDFYVLFDAGPGHTVEIEHSAIK